MPIDAVYTASPGPGSARVGAAAGTVDGDVADLSDRAARRAANRGVEAVPRPPYRIGTYDVLQIGVFGTMPGQPIDDYFLVEGDGIVTLPPAYGVVRVEGMTMEEAAAVIARSLQGHVLKNPQVTVHLSRSASSETSAANIQGWAGWRHPCLTIRHDSLGWQDRSGSAGGHAGSVLPNTLSRRRWASTWCDSTARAIT